MVPKQIYKFLFYYRRSHVLALAASIFSLLYHIVFFIVFKKLNVMPMFYFNIFSITIFTLLSIHLRYKQFKLWHYLLCYVEVVSHQVLANYYIGNTAGFHFLILLLGVVSFLLFEEKYNIAIFFALLTASFFIVIDMLSPYIPGIIQIEYKYLMIIRGVNLVVSIFMIALLILIFAFIAYTTESNLEQKVKRRTKEAFEQHRKVYKLQDHIIYSLANLVENRDTDTGDHIMRTSAYVKLIAEEALKAGYEPDTLNENFISLMVKAAPMHDIGKIVISDTVLKKPGKLTPDEFEMIKLHTTEGGRIIKDVMSISENIDYIRIATEIATSHHERWDGTGYPYRIAATEIPLSARIMAIADVFDALVSPRCYKDPIPQEKAFQIIREESGTHFDPELVKIFLSAKEKAVTILENYSK